MNLENKIEIVKKILKDKKVAVAFSGGADSTLLAYLASKVSSEVLAITVDNHLFPAKFIENTKRAALKFGVKHHIIDLNFFDDEEFLQNKSSRCYSCRNLMYAQIKNYALENDYNFICDGNNISDLINDRPGILITYDEKFSTPFIEAKLTSREIHEYLEKNKIPYSKSTTCLATRIPTDTIITTEGIEKIQKSENFLSEISGCELVKVRDLNGIGMCEVDDLSKVVDEKSLNEINDSLKSYGFKKVCLNLSLIDDNEEIVLDYDDGKFQYQLPYTINMKSTKKEENEKIVINENGLIEGHDFQNYDEALFEFMEVLSKIRRNL